jgi:hypothetical protein
MKIIKFPKVKKYSGAQAGLEVGREITKKKTKKREAGFPKTETPNQMRNPVAESETPLPNQSRVLAVKPVSKSELKKNSKGSGSQPKEQLGESQEKNKKTRSGVSDRGWKKRQSQTTLPDIIGNPVGESETPGVSTRLVN